MSELCSHGVNPGFCLQCMDDPCGLRDENANLRKELRRCLIALEQVNRIAGDMLDETRRRGPGQAPALRGYNDLEQENSNERTHGALEESLLQKDAGDEVGPISFEEESA